MPEITLEVLSLDANPLPVRQCLFAGVGGTIGRDEGNTLVLQDKHRRVSRLHASITFPQDQPTITNASASLPVTVGSSVLACGQKMQISAGDLIEIGPFVLRVCASVPCAEEDAFLAHAQPTILAQVSGLPPIVRSMAPVISEVDPFADLFADILPSAPQAEIRSETALKANAVQDIAAATPMSVELVNSITLPTASNVEGLDCSPFPQQPIPFASDSSGTSPDGLTAAFMKAAGLPPSALPGGLTPEIMGVIGAMLRAATAGAIDMLATRAATKLEVQASVTIICAQFNNPLKFLPNVESALQQMLGEKLPGFMRADEAMQDAFDDLRAHEIGVMAGMRAALTETLGRFDPSVLEKRLTRGALIDSLLPAIRKTKLWEIYLEQHARIRREAEDDFQSVFGRSFLEAYEQETARVKARTSKSGKK